MVSVQYKYLVEYLVEYWKNQLEAIIHPLVGATLLLVWLKQTEVNNFEIGN